MTPLDLATMQENAGRAERFLSLLANQRRLLIMCQLVENELNVGQLQEKSGLSQSALSQHLAKLRSAGLVNARRDAQAIYYSIASAEAKKVLDTLYEIYCAPDGPASSASKE